MNGTGAKYYNLCCGKVDVGVLSVLTRVLLDVPVVCVLMVPMVRFPLVCDSEATVQYSSALPIYK